MHKGQSTFPARLITGPVVALVFMHFLELLRVRLFNEFAESAWVIHRLSFYNQGDDTHYDGYQRNAYRISRYIGLMAFY